MVLVATTSGYAPGVLAPDQPRPDLERAFAGERRRLWGLCYRMTGVAADADDLLQEVFARALGHPPADLERDLSPWLTRVAVNACRDHLRRRKLRGYVGPFVPEPVQTDRLAALCDTAPAPDARYERAESTSLAFLRALEALSATQRAVLVLRDVLDYSVRETAEALELSEANVKTTLHRAREAMASYDARRMSAGAASGEAAGRALSAFMLHLLAGNVPALQELLAAEVVTLNDGGGRYVAAQRPVVGRDKVILFHRKADRRPLRLAACSLNGAPALLFELAPGKNPRLPPRGAVWVELDADGRIAEVTWLLEDAKLAALPWHLLRPPSLPLALDAVRAALTTPPPRRWLGAAARRGLQVAAAHGRALLEDLASRLGA